MKPETLNIAPEDDIIVQDTCIPLVDAEPEKVARALSGADWDTRARFFRGIITESFDCMVKVGEVLKVDEIEDMGALGFYSLTYVEMHRRIAQVLEIWDEPMPETREAASVYALSMAPEHRVQASRFVAKHYGGAMPENWCRLFEPQLGSMLLYNMGRLQRVGLSELWRQHREGCQCHCASSNEADEQKAD